MKKLIIMISIILCFILGILGYYYIKEKINVEKEIIYLNNNQVDIVSNIATNSIKIDDILIENIMIKNTKYITFDIKSQTTNLADKDIKISFYNSNTKLSVTYKEIFLKDYLNSKSNNIKIDVSDIYNNPSKIELEIK